MAWLYLFLAGLFEVAWAIGLKYTEGFSRLFPSVLTVAAMGLSLALLGLALKSLPVGTAYAVWTGIGAVGTAALGIILFSEPETASRLVCIGLIVCAIAGLKFASERLEETLRIDVHFQPHIAALLGRRGKPSAQVSRKVESARRFHQQPEAMPATHDRDRCFGRTEHADMFVARSGLGEGTAVGFGGVPLICGDNQPCQPPKWRIARALALFNFVLVEGLAVAGDKRAHDRMFWLVGLQVAETPSLLTPCSSNHLMQQLKSTLRRTGVAVAKAKIRVDDADQVEFGKMVPFGDKLRTDDEIETSLDRK